MNVQCPTCGATGSEPCIRGRKPVGHAGVEGAIWQAGKPLGKDHDSRVAAMWKEIAQ